MPTDLLYLELRPCLAPPPEQLDAAADLLDRAADALINGETDLAAQLLRDADISALHAHATLLMSAPADILRLRPIPTAPPRLSRLERAATRMPGAGAEREVFRRDGYRCRYCGRRVVLKRARSVLTTLFPDVVRWPGGRGGDKGKHGAFFALNSVIDHVIPHVRGGDNSMDNLVTACWPCNFGKEDYLLEELGLMDPRVRPPIVDGWDGLERILSLALGRKAPPPPAETSKRPRETEPTPIHAKGGARCLDEWLRPLELRSKDSAVRLRQFLTSLPASHVSLSINQCIVVNVVAGSISFAVLGIDQDGNVDVPWSIEGEKERFKPFAIELAQSIPRAVLYETKTMWRVDGQGAARGQVSIDELLSCADVARDCIARLVGVVQ